MLKVKDIQIKPLTPKNANDIARALHYSGKVVPNSQLHLGVFLGGKCGGVMQFGPSLCKRKMLSLVKGTKWNGFIELNRMALAEWLPRNSESRALSVALKIIKKQYPFIKWVISFADATQSGDGAIYRACGFSLIGIKKNTGLRVNPQTNEVTQTLTAYHRHQSAEFRTWEAVLGYQLRYIYFLDRTCKDDLAVPVIPFSEIDKRGISMYRGKRTGSDTSDTAVNHTAEGGAAPTPVLQGGIMT